MMLSPSSEHNQNHGHGHGHARNNFFPSSSATTTTHNNHNQNNYPVQNKRLRTGSISGRLRTASDLEECGLIDKYQKGIVKDLIIGGDSRILNLLDRFNSSGDTTALKDDLKQSLERRHSISIDPDLLDGLDFDFLNGFSTNVEVDGEREIYQVFEEDEGDEPLLSFGGHQHYGLIGFGGNPVSTSNASAMLGSSDLSTFDIMQTSAEFSNKKNFANDHPIEGGVEKDSAHAFLSESVRRQERSSSGDSSIRSISELGSHGRVDWADYESVALALKLKEKKDLPGSRRPRSSSFQQRTVKIEPSDEGAGGSPPDFILTSHMNRSRRPSQISRTGDELIDAEMDAVNMDDFFGYLQEETEHPHFLLSEEAQLSLHFGQHLAHPHAQPLPPPDEKQKTQEVRSPSPRTRTKKKGMRSKADANGSGHGKVKLEPTTPSADADTSGRASRSKVRAAAGLISSPSLVQESVRPHRDTAGNLSRTTAPAAASAASAAASSLSASSSSSSLRNSSASFSASVTAAVAAAAAAAVSSSSTAVPITPSTAQGSGSGSGLGSVPSSALTARLHAAHSSSSASLLPTASLKSNRPVMLPSTQIHVQSQLAQSQTPPLPQGQGFSSSSSASNSQSISGGTTAGSGSMEGYVGAYSAEQRRLRVQRFVAARTKRVWTKKVKYDVRKNFADSRIRVKGRFVKKEDEESLRDVPPSPNPSHSLNHHNHTHNQNFSLLQGNSGHVPHSSLPMSMSFPLSSMTIPSLNQGGQHPTQQAQSQTQAPPLPHLLPHHHLGANLTPSNISSSQFPLSHLQSSGHSVQVPTFMSSLHAPITSCSSNSGSGSGSGKGILSASGSNGNSNNNNNSSNSSSSQPNPSSTIVA